MVRQTSRLDENKRVALSVRGRGPGTLIVVGKAAGIHSQGIDECKLLAGIIETGRGKLARSDIHAGSIIHCREGRLIFDHHDPLSGRQGRAKREGIFDPGERQVSEIDGITRDIHELNPLGIFGSSRGIIHEFGNDEIRGIGDRSEEKTPFTDRRPLAVVQSPCANKRAPGQIDRGSSAIGRRDSGDLQIQSGITAATTVLVQFHRNDIGSFKQISRSQRKGSEIYQATLVGCGVLRKIAIRLISSGHISPVQFTTIEIHNRSVIPNQAHDNLGKGVSIRDLEGLAKVHCRQTGRLNGNHLVDRPTIDRSVSEQSLPYIPSTVVKAGMLPISRPIGGMPDDHFTVALGHSGIEIAPAIFLESNEGSLIRSRTDKTGVRINPSAFETRVRSIGRIINRSRVCGELQIPSDGENAPGLRRSIHEKFRSARAWIKRTVVGKHQSAAAGEVVIDKAVLFGEPVNVARVESATRVSPAG